MSLCHNAIIVHNVHDILVQMFAHTLIISNVEPPFLEDKLILHSLTGKEPCGNYNYDCQPQLFSEEDF